LYQQESIGGPHTRSQGACRTTASTDPHTTAVGCYTRPGLWLGGRSQTGMHLEHTPGYGETPLCSAFDAAEGPLRGPPAAPLFCSLRRGALALIAPGFAPHLPGAACLLDGGPAQLPWGEESGFRFNDSTGAGRLPPGGRLKIESATSRERGSGICFPAQRVRGPSRGRLGAFRGCTCCSRGTQSPRQGRPSRGGSWRGASARSRSLRRRPQPQEETPALLSRVVRIGVSG